MAHRQNTPQNRGKIVRADAARGNDLAGRPAKGKTAPSGRPGKKRKTSRGV